jgi:pimeloyl-ACP methyl ester carboxylesterase
VYAPLHPGVGGSEGVDTLDDLLDLTLVYDELLQALGLTTAYLSGHFFGGMMAAELAALFPGRAAGLALCSPLGLWLDQAPVADVAILPREELRALLWLDPEAEVARRWAALPEWQRRIKGSEVRLLPGGHMLLDEAPAAAAEAVAAFLG